jgi:hypothetical protein
MKARLLMAREASVNWRTFLDACSLQMRSSTQLIANVSAEVGV